MSKWRPSKFNCLYVIPDIHGAYSLLEQILKRILPLRKSDGGQDKIIFLGDYIDRGRDGHKVLDTLIELKKEYKERVVCLCGNHELMLLQGLEHIPYIASDTMYQMWVEEGGKETIAGYLERAGIASTPESISNIRLKNIIPQEHIDFLMSLEGCYEEDEFVFVHGGCEPDRPPTDFSVETLCWDRSLFRFVVRSIQDNQKLPWDKPIIITGHNTNGTGKPVIKDQFMMLDCGAPKRLLVLEARSRRAYMAEPEKRLLKFEIKETILQKKKGTFRRISK